MAHAPLNLNPDWQAWHLAGLSCLLLDEASASQVRTAGESLPARPPRPTQPPPGPAQPSRRLPAGGSETGSSDSLRPPAAPLTENPATLRSSAARPAVAPAPPVELVELEEEIDPSAWPAPWRDLLGRMQPAPLAWTYPELGEDLLLGGGQERSAALREMISRLRLPRGSSTFWPARLPAALNSGAGGQAGGRAAEHSAVWSEAAPDYFRDGLKLLEARFLIVFGADALAGTTYQALQLKPFSELLSDGRLILSLPDFASLLALPGRLDKVVLFLDSVLSRFLRA